MPSAPLLRLSILGLALSLPLLGSSVERVAHAALIEDCDNCVDDHDPPNGLVDRFDPECGAPLANGGGAGIGDGTRGKGVLKCHKTLGKAGLAFSSKRLKRLYGCVLPIFQCVQTKNGDAACLQKTGAKCAAAFAAASADEAKLLGIIAKGCGDAVVSHADLDPDVGLGLEREEVACLNLEGTPTDESIGSFANCLLQHHIVHTNRTLSAGIPRARELLLAVGRDPDLELPGLDPGADGTGQGLGDLGKPAVKCQKGVTKASLKLGTAISKALQKCVDLGMACLQTKNADPACVAKAQLKCAKLSDKVQNQQNGVLAKILGSTAKACEGLSTSQFTATNGLGFSAQADRCGQLGVPLFGIQGRIACAGVQQFCEGKQMLLREVPRLEEFLDLLNVVITGL